MKRKEKKKDEEEVSTFTDEQRLMIFAEIEDFMFARGMHRDTAVDKICEKYKCTRARAKWWVRDMLKKWRESIDSEDLAERHYQLDRMAHHLYSEAMEGMSWGKAKASIEKVVDFIRKNQPNEAIALLGEMEKSKVPDLRIAQRVLWNLCAVSGYGNKVTVDVSGAGVTVTPGRE